jgi:DNA-binding CsgD family transcriptional regulator
MSLDSVLPAHYLNSCPTGQLNMALERLATWLMREAMTSDLSVVAVRLVDSACRTPDGDREVKRVYIAVALLQERPSFGPNVPCGLFEVWDSAAHGCTPSLENLYRTRNAGMPAPAIYRSLSRRQIDVLQMIARGMSNKCIARSLGIAPETVKTHAKCILSKLEARTRAQAVARAEAIGLL